MRRIAPVGDHGDGANGSRAQTEYQRGEGGQTV